MIKSNTKILYYNCLDDIGNGLEIVNREFKSNVEYQVRYKNDSTVPIIFNKDRDTKDIVYIDDIDQLIISTVYSIRRSKLLNNQEPTFTINELIETMYNGKKQKKATAENIKKRIEKLSGIKMYVDLSSIKNEFKNNVRTLYNTNKYLLNVTYDTYLYKNNVLTTEYTIHDFPSKFYSELSERITTHNIKEKDILYNI